MAYTIGDIFIGDYHLTKNFSAEPDQYSARYKSRGHNGIDFDCPSMTILLAAAGGYVHSTGFDPAGYGNWVKIVHTGFLTLYAHLNDIQVKKDDVVVAGQLIGHSNNTGFSQTPHLHFALAPCAPTGEKTQADNGFGGYIDPMGPDVVWDLKNLSAPVVPGQNEPVKTKEIPETEYNALTLVKKDHDAVIEFLNARGFQSFLVQQEYHVTDAPIPGHFIAEFIGKLIADQGNFYSPPPVAAPLPDPNNPGQTVSDEPFPVLVATISNWIKPAQEAFSAMIGKAWQRGRGIISAARRFVFVNG